MEQNINSKSGEWFETSIRYDKVFENGIQKKVTERYVVEALSFAEAENAIMEEMIPFVSGEIFISAIGRAQYREILFSNNATDDRLYKAKISFITIDEKTEKEKRSSVSYLIQAGSLEKARKNIDSFMSDGIIDFEITSVTETKLLEVFER